MDRAGLRPGRLWGDQFAGRWPESDLCNETRRKTVRSVRVNVPSIVFPSTLSFHRPTLFFEVMVFFVLSYTQSPVPMVIDWPFTILSAVTLTLPGSLAFEMCHTTTSSLATELLATTIKSGMRDH